MSVAAPIRAPMPSRLGRRRLVLVILGGLAVVIALTVLAAALLAPAAPKVPCTADKPCGKPPKAQPLVNLKVWQSPELGYGLRYSGDSWKVQDAGPRSVRLASTEGDFALEVSGTPAAQQTPTAAFDAALSDARTRVLGLTDDTEPTHRVLAPSLGINPGAGGAFVGTVDTPQGTSTPVSVVILTAGNRRVTVTAVGATGETSERRRHGLMSRADSVLNTVRLPGETVG